MAVYSNSGKILQLPYAITRWSEPPKPALARLVLLRPDWIIRTRRQGFLDDAAFGRLFAALSRSAKATQVVDLGTKLVQIGPRRKGKKLLTA